MTPSQNPHSPETSPARINLSAEQGPARPIESGAQMHFALNFSEDLTQFTLPQIASHIGQVLKLKSALISGASDFNLLLQPSTKQVAVASKKEVKQVANFEKESLHILQSDNFVSVLSCGEPLLASNEHKTRSLDWFVMNKTTNEAIHLSLQVKDGKLQPIIGFVGQEKIRTECQLPGDTDTEYFWMPANFGLEEYLGFLRINYGELPQA